MERKTPPLRESQVRAFKLYRRGVAFMYEIPRTRRREGSSPPARSTCNVSKIGEEPTHLESLLPLSFSFALNRCSMSCAASNLMGAITGAPIPFSHDENDLRLMGLMALSPPDRLNDLSTLLNVVVTSSLWIDILQTPPFGRRAIYKISSTDDDWSSHSSTRLLCTHQPSA